MYVPGQPDPLAPLRLDDVVVESIHARATSERSSRAASAFPLLEMEYTNQVLQGGRTLKFLISMRVRLNRQREDFDRWGFALDLSLAGFFTLEIDESDEDADLFGRDVGTMVLINAPSILYGVARGFVIQAFALTNVGRVVLPSVDFTAARRRRSGTLFVRADGVGEGGS